MNEHNVNYCFSNYREPVVVKFLKTEDNDILPRKAHPDPLTDILGMIFLL